MPLGWGDSQDHPRNEGQMEEFARKNKRGPAPSNPSEATLQIIEMFSEMPSFTGLQGFETGLGGFKVITQDQVLAEQ